MVSGSTWAQMFGWGWVAAMVATGVLKCSGGRWDLERTGELEASPEWPDGLASRLCVTKMCEVHCLLYAQKCC